MKTVSIAMATYNGERFILEQLRSLASQTHLPDELVVCDDCSADRTVDIIMEFAATAPFPVRLHVNDKRLGWAANFMGVVVLCSHDVIAFCDQDDVWSPEKIETLLPKFQGETLLVCHEADIVDADLNYMRPLMRLPPSKVAFEPLQIGPWDNAFGFTQMVSRDLLRFNDYWAQSLDHDRPASPMAHDQWFSFLASVLGRVVYVSTPLAKYRQHGRNAVGTEYHSHGLFSASRAQVNFKSIVWKAKASEARERILTSMRDTIDAPLRSRVDEAIQRYALLSRQLRTRVTLYSSPEIVRRMQSFANLLRMHSYSRLDHGWRFGANSLLKDLVLGVSIGNVLVDRPSAAADGC